MRVTLVSNTLPPEGRGGAEAYVAALAEFLRPRHEVMVLSGAATSSLPGVANVRLPHLPPVADDATAPRKAAWHLRDQWMPSVHRAVSVHLRTFTPDVVHTHEPQGLSAAVFTAIGAARVAHVHTAHDLNLLCVRTSMTKAGAPCGGRCRDCGLQRLIRGTAFKRRVTRFIAVSDFIRRRHVDAGVVPEERTMTLHLAAEPGITRVRRPGEGALRLGFIGTLAPHKGVLTLLAALERTPAAWSLDIAGGGPLADQVRAAAARDSRVRFHGHVAGPAKEAFFERLDLLVIPSEWEEPGATVCFEAAVRGLPSVVSDRGGLPELPEVTVFRAGDPVALCDAVHGLAQEPGRLEAKSRRLVDAHERFLWSTHGARVERELEEAASHPG